MVGPTRKRKAGDSKDTGVQNRSKRAVICETSIGSNSSSLERLQYEDPVFQVLGIAATPKTAEIIILELMRKYLATLKDLLRSVHYLSELRIWLISIWMITALENKLDVSFSNVKYRDIAPMVGLAPGKDGKTE